MNGYRNTHREKLMLMYKHFPKKVMNTTCSKSW